MTFHRCVRCGRNEVKILSNDKFFCNECAKLFGTCAMCEHSLQCDFSTNPTSLPQFVMKHIHQQTPLGYVEQIKEFPNQERIKLCCLDKCICCKTCDDEKVRCLRQFGTCENYKEIEF